MGAYEDELTLRDLIGILQKKKIWIWGFTLTALLLGALYAFFLTRPVYESSAVLSVSPLKVKAQLENKIQLQQRGLLTFEGLKALAFSQANLAETLARAQKSPHWPAAWRDLPQNALLARLEGMLSLKDRTAAKAPASEPPTLIAVHRVRAGDPDLAAVLANAWAGVTAEMVNDLPAKQLEANLGALAAQISPAEANYRRAQDAWEAFQKSSNLAAWKKELDARIKEKVALQGELEALKQRIQEKEARLRALEEALSREKRTFSGQASPAQLAFAGRDLQQAKAFIADQYASASKAYNDVTGKLVAFKRKTPIERWKRELNRYRDRVAAIELRLRQIKTERAKLQGKLKTLEARLRQTPRTLVLKREVTADPVVGLAAAGELKALRGLQLENETVYGVYTELAKNKTPFSWRKTRSPKRKRRSFWSGTACCRPPTSSGPRSARPRPSSKSSGSRLPSPRPATRAGRSSTRNTAPSEAISASRTRAPATKSSGPKNLPSRST